MRVDEVRPFGDRILVRPDPKLETSDGGIYVPETVRADNPNYYTMTGVVVALGDGIRDDVYECKNQQCRQQWRRTANERCPVCGATMGLRSTGGRMAFDVAVGDRVVFGRFAGKQVELEVDPVEAFQAGFRLAEMGPTLVKFFIMRESEVLGVIDAGARVLPGYVPASWNRPKGWKDDPAMAPIVGPS